MKKSHFDKALMQQLSKYAVDNKQKSWYFLIEAFLLLIVLEVIILNVENIYIQLLYKYVLAKLQRIKQLLRSQIQVCL